MIDTVVYAWRGSYGATGDKLGPYPIVDRMPKSGGVICLGAMPNVSLLSQGVRWLEHWEVICPLRPYRELLEQVEDSAAVVKALGDLRVPVYDPRLIFMRVSPKTRSFWKTFKELSRGYDMRVAFHLAVWEVMPYIKPLPAEGWIIEPWTNGK